MGQEGLTSTPDAGARAPADAAVESSRPVLVIEDEPNISEAIRFILKRDGWQVAVLGTGENAVQTVIDTGPALVILDVMLPGVSGFDILQEMRANPATQDVPVILLTANGKSSARELAAEYGASKFMAKPFANADLLHAVRDLVQI